MFFFFASEYKIGTVLAVFCYVLPITQLSPNLVGASIVGGVAF